MIRTMIASCLLACSGFVSAQMTGGNPEGVKQTAPAPLYRDPVYDGVADPVVVWNKEDRSWWMLYTQRPVSYTHLVRRVQCSMSASKTSFSCCVMSLSKMNAFVS